MNKEFDRLTMVDQELADKFSKTITAQDFDADRSLVLPLLNACKGKALVFDKTSGDLTVSIDDYDDQAADAAVSAAAALASQNAAASSASAASTSAGNAHTSEVNAAASAAAAALNVVSAAMGPVCSAATLAAGRTAFGLGAMAEKASVTNAELSEAVSVAKGGTGATDAATARSNLGVGVDPSTCGFRLTLTSLNPVTVSDVTGAATIYCTPFKSNMIALYVGGAWVARSSAEFNKALGTLTSGMNYDVFCYDNSGTPTLEFYAWSSDTARQQGLQYRDGVLVKGGDATRRYMGTFRTTATTTTEDSAAKRFLWNWNHRVPRNMVRKESTSTWTYTTNSWRLANGSSANILDFVVGVAGDAVSATCYGTAKNGNGVAHVSVAVSFDNTASPSSFNINSSPVGDVTGVDMCMQASYSGIPSQGRHYLGWLETSSAVGTTTWSGASGEANSGIVGSITA